MALAMSFGYAKNFDNIVEQHVSKLLSISAGDGSGYRFFELTDVNNVEEIFHHEKEPTSIVERLPDSSLVAVVSSNQMRTMNVWHWRKGTKMCELIHRNTVLAIHMNRTRMIVCVSEQLCIYDMKDIRHLHTITTDNPRGLSALTVSRDRPLAAYPASSSSGAVVLFDLVAMHSKATIKAHKSAMSALCFNCRGTRLATASETGTVIRVFCTPEGTRLFEYRRGLARCADICGLNFSICGTYLASSSNTETVHVFRLADVAGRERNNNGPGDDGGAAGAVASSSYFGGYCWSALQTVLPTAVSEVLSPERAFATAYLPKSGVKSTVAIVPIQGHDRLLVLTSHYILYIFNIPKEGGNCPLYVTHHLRDVPSRSRRESSSSASRSRDSTSGTK